MCVDTGVELKKF